MNKDFLNDVLAYVQNAQKSKLGIHLDIQLGIQINIIR